MTQVPSASRTLRVLRFLGAQPGPVPLARIADAVQIPRSSAYHLIGVMVAEGFVMHLPDDNTFGLGPIAFEVGSGYARQAPLQRVARRPLMELVEDVGQSAHMAILQSRDVLYVLEERAPGRPSLVTDVGVRLPSHSTASGRAMLATLPAAQVRALYPSPEHFVARNGTGPRSLRQLQTELIDSRRRGYAVETGEVTEGLGSVAVPVVDHNDYPVCAVAITYPATEDIRLQQALASAATTTARSVRRRLGVAR